MTASQHSARGRAPRKALALGFGLIAFIVLIGLGTWQVERLHWKEGLLQTISERMHAAPLPLAEVERQFAAGGDMAHVDPGAAQSGDRCAAEIIVGHPAGETDLMPEQGELGRDIGLGARHPHVEARGLEQQFAPRRRQPQHDLPEGENAWGGHRASHPPSTARICPWT